MTCDLGEAFQGFIDDSEGQDIFHEILESNSTTFWQNYKLCCEKYPLFKQKFGFLRCTCERNIDPAVIANIYDFYTQAKLIPETKILL